MNKVALKSPSTINELTSITISDRIKSVDLYRGFTMFLLIGESTLFYRYLLSADNNSIGHFIGIQFSHHPWNGLNFWDLIQPFFMFIVGVAIPFAVANRLKKGDSNKLIMLNVLKRSFLLLLFGWAIACIGTGEIVFRFQNVLSQLSVTYLIAFLIMRKSYSFQLVFTFLILLLIDLAYRFFPVEGFDQPWVAYQNLGAWVNNKIEGVDKSSIWATLNAIPTTAHTVWGVMCGQLLMSNRSARKKIQILVCAALTCLLIGYLLDILNITPIIKKIATSSFIFASGGWAILALCFFYWLVDVKKIFEKGSRFFIIVGMNTIFIYLFFEVGGANLVSKIVAPFTKAIFLWGGELTIGVMTSLVVWAILWYLCYWLYKNRIFIKI